MISWRMINNTSLSIRKTWHYFLWYGYMTSLPPRRNYMVRSTEKPTCNFFSGHEQSSSQENMFRSVSSVLCEHGKFQFCNVSPPERGKLQKGNLSKDVNYGSVAVNWKKNKTCPVQPERLCILNNFFIVDIFINVTIPLGLLNFSVFIIISLEICSAHPFKKII